MKLEDFEHYRREMINVREIFPAFNKPRLLAYLPLPTSENPHNVVLNIALSLWDGGYDFILDEFGFHDPAYARFAGHCHQITPALGLVLKTIGFQSVAYLECFRADPKTLQMVPAQEEQSEMREEFCKIGRIPYCLLEVIIDSRPFYLTGKHIKRVDGQPQALLTPACYRDRVGSFTHQEDITKSGIYLQTVESEPFVWMKQVPGKDKKPEYFKTFAYMSLEV